MQIFVRPELVENKLKTIDKEATDFDEKDYWSNEWAKYWDWCEWYSEEKKEINIGCPSYYRCFYQQDEKEFRVNTINPFQKMTSLDESRVNHYVNKLKKGEIPTAMSLGMIDRRKTIFPTKNYLIRQSTQTVLSNFLIDGHHKIAAAARCNLPCSLLVFLPKQPLTYFHKDPLRNYDKEISFFAGQGFAKVKCRSKHALPYPSDPPFLMTQDFSSLSWYLTLKKKDVANLWSYIFDKNDYGRNNRFDPEEIINSVVFSDDKKQCTVEFSKLQYLKNAIRVSGQIYGYEGVRKFSGHYIDVKHYKKMDWKK